jgi:thymidylate synthase
MKNSKSYIPKMRTFRVIAAAHNGWGGGIGFGGKLPWHLEEDLAHFRRRTKDCVVIMGRKTWESLPKRPLSHRVNIILSTKASKPLINGSILIAKTLNEALNAARLRQSKGIYVIGGADVYSEAIDHPRCEALEMTNVCGLQTTFDAFFPAHRQSFQLESSQPAKTFDGSFEVWQNTEDHCSPELDYLKALRTILDQGEQTLDRTGVGTLQCFGLTLRFPLEGDRIPLMTTKRVHWKSVAEEMLQFARGDINARNLEAKGVRIWSGHTSRAHLDSIGGYDVETGSMWKAYGWQWRQWGLPYLGLEAPYRAIREGLSGTGMLVDQLQGVVDTLRSNPMSRRIVLSAWNVGDLDQMCLPPCHVLYVFNVTRGRLNCQMTQRSWDMFLGAPFNIAGTALLVRLLCATTGLQPGEIKIDAANAHIYLNHVAQVKEQLSRGPLYRFPRLEIRKPLSSLRDWETLTADDLVLHGYRSHATIKGDMAV